MASKSKGRSMKMDSSTQLLMLVAVAAVMYMLFKGVCGQKFLGTTFHRPFPENDDPDSDDPW